MRRDEEMKKREVEGRKDRKKVRIVDGKLENRRKKKR